MILEMSQSFKLFVNVLIQYLSSMLNDNFLKNCLFWEIPFFRNFALPSFHIIILYRREMVGEFVM